MTIVSEYINYLSQYSKLYGDKTIVLIQVGSFYEFYGINDTDHIHFIAKLLNILVTKKNKSINQVDLSNPFMAGFPVAVLNKYLPILLDNHFTVVIVDQFDDSGVISRKISAIYSDTIRPLELDHSNSSLSIVVLEQLSNNIISSISTFQNLSNTLSLSETYHDLPSNINDFICDILQNTSSSEILLYTNIPTNISHRLPSSVTLHIYPIKLHNIHTQNNLFTQIYTHVQFGLLDPISFFNLEKYTHLSLSLFLLLQFIQNHLPLYLKNISIPIIQSFENKLELFLDITEQLDLSGLFDKINKTLTVVGSRALKKLLFNPFSDPDFIQSRYQLTSNLLPFQKLLKTHLSEIYDLAALHRKFSLNKMTFLDFYNLHTSYTNLLSLYKTIGHFVNTLNLNTLENFINIYSEILDTTLLSSSPMPFKKTDSTLNLFKDFDQIQTIKSELQNIQLYYNNICCTIFKKDSEFVKLIIDKDSCYLSCTKMRGIALQKETDTLDFKFLTNETRMYNDKLVNLSNQLIVLQDSFQSSIQLFFSQLQDKLYNPNLFTEIIKTVELLDIIYSNISVSELYSYSQPTIQQSKESFFDIHGIRHPILELINQDTEYITNDISLNSSNYGVILYAINSSGKSSLLKSIGLNIILAQAGLYTPCTNMIYYPFKNIICQLNSNDNIWKSQSSFIREMIGLKIMLQNANQFSLCLADELTSSTEQISATAIFSSTVLTLVDKKSKFFFTTHLHSVAELPQIKNNKAILVKHLKVQVNNNGSITFLRKLLDGVCDPLYGLEIAQAVGLPKDFIQLAFSIRNSKSKPSKYNSKKILDKCEICSYTPTHSYDTPLQAHHIKFQASANHKNFIGHFHKNIKHNLATLCHQCHQDLHNNKITINGYIQTSNGIILDFIKN